LLLVCPAVPPSTTPSSELCNNDYGFREFTGVDVFSAISRTGTLAVSDTEATFRNAALDYVLNFDCVNVDDPQPGKVLQVFRDGWHPVATSDNFVARWIAPAGCIANAVRIDAAGPGLGHDDIAQIDAIKAFPTVPPPPPVPQPPSLVLLVAAALFALLWRHLRVDMM
jgi:hypothetical protein